MRYSTVKIYALALFSLLLFAQCQPTNWHENYREKEKSPFGTHIIFNESENLFNTSEKEVLKQNILDYLIVNYQQEEADFGNYICIKFAANKLSESGINELLRFVYKGNDAFISLNYFSQELQNLLDFSTENLDEKVFSPVNLKEFGGDLSLNNTDFKQHNFSFDRNLRRHYFTSFNEDKTIVLGTQEISASINEPNFIKIYHGKGAIYLHTQPIAFTNYYLLDKENYKYAENVLSYLPDRKILWDPQIKHADYSPKDSSDDRESVFKFFMQNPSLKWSLYVFLFGLLLFMAFNARRKQRPIPIIDELKNSSVEFTHTIANLYLKENDHKNTIDKKILYFLEKIRRRYLIETSNLNKDFIKKLASKSGNTFERTNYLINTIIALNKKSIGTKDELYRLNKLIENFFNSNNHGRND